MINILIFLREPPPPPADKFFCRLLFKPTTVKTGQIAGFSMLKYVYINDNFCLLRWRTFMEARNMTGTGSQYPQVIKEAAK